MSTWKRPELSEAKANAHDPHAAQAPDWLVWAIFLAIVGYLISGIVYAVLAAGDRAGMEGSGAMWGLVFQVVAWPAALVLR